MPTSHLRLFFSKCTYEVLAGEKTRAGQTACPSKVILRYDAGDGRVGSVKGPGGENGIGLGVGIGRRCDGGNSRRTICVPAVVSR